jgi:16S rRNA (adenine1518-N6/adenine1519-N6)-dimethyltransferase
LKAKKSFGQHFLNRDDVAEQIAQSLLTVSSHPRILEVGPGKGMLTRFLLRQPAALKVVEADRDMVAYLEKHFPQLHGNILSGDFLKTPLDQVFDGQPFCLIGNFPYNISSQILFHALRYQDLVPEIVGMFQKEMAERVVARPGSKTYGAISVLVQASYAGELLLGVDKSCFSPPPQVQSAVIRLLRKEHEEWACDERQFRRVVKQAFSQRRKMLRNSLKALVGDFPDLGDPFFQKRPEQLSLEEYKALTLRLQPWL